MSLDHPVVRWCPGSTSRTSQKCFPQSGNRCFLAVRSAQWNAEEFWSHVKAIYQNYLSDFLLYIISQMFLFADDIRKTCFAIWFITLLHFPQIFYFPFTPVSVTLLFPPLVWPPGQSLKLVLCTKTTIFPKWTTNTRSLYSKLPLRCSKPLALTKCDLFENAKVYWAPANVNSENGILSVICWP